MDPLVDETFADTFEARLAFLGLGAPERQTLKQIRRALGEDIPRVIDAFYEKILEQPKIAALLQSPGTLDRLRHLQVAHLEDLLSAHWDGPFLDRRRAAGRAHLQTGLEPGWYMGSFAHLLSLLLPYAHRAGGDAPRTLVASVLLDAGLVLDAYRYERIRDVDGDGNALSESGLDIETLRRRATEIDLSLAQAEPSWNHRLGYLGLTEPATSRSPGLDEPGIRELLGALEDIGALEGAAHRTTVLREAFSKWVRRLGQGSGAGIEGSALPPLLVRSCGLAPAWIIFGLGHQILEATRESGLSEEGLDLLTRRVFLEAGLALDAWSAMDLEEIRRSQGFSKSIVSNVPGGLAVISRTLRVIDTNETLTRLIGRDNEDLRALHLDELLPGFNLSEKARTVLHSDRRVDDWITELSLGGSRRWIRISLSPMTSGGRELVLLMVEDLSEVVRLRDSVRATKARLRSVVEEVDGIVWEADVPGDGDRSWSFRLVSRQAEDFLGYPTREWTTRKDFWRERIHPEDRGHALAHFERMARGAERSEEEYRLRTRDGASRWILDRCRRTTPDEDGAIRIVGLIVDVTRRHQLEEQLNRAQKLEAAGMLAGGLAHDFNNLMMVVGCYADLLREELEGRPGALERVDRILGAADRAASLTRQLMAFARRQVLHPAPLDLNEVLRDLRDMMERMLGEDITIELDLAPDLPLALADRSQIDQVVMNLAVNARDAMPRGGKLIITTRSGSPSRFGERGRPTIPGEVELTISDTGVGMAPETAEHAFEPFFTTKAPGKGTGLGLATVYGVLQQSGGHIDLETAPGEGACFRIRLPRATHERRESQTTSPSQAGPEPSGNILLVEDDAEVRSLLDQVLHEAGYTVRTAGTLAEAERKAAEATPDLLLTDEVLPDGRGGDLRRQLLAKQPDLRVLVMSGYPQDSSFETASEHTRTLQKPFRNESLLSLIRELFA